MGLLRRGVPDGLAARLLLWFVVVVDSFLGDVADQGSAVDVRGSVELTTVHALLNDLPNGGLRQAPGVYYSQVILRGLPSLYEGRLHLHLNEVVIRNLIDGVSYYRLEDGDVPCPQLVQLVPFPMRRGSSLQCWCEACKHESGVHSL